MEDKTRDKGIAFGSFMTHGRHSVCPFYRFIEPNGCWVYILSCPGAVDVVGRAEGGGRYA